MAAYLNRWTTGLACPLVALALFTGVADAQTKGVILKEAPLFLLPEPGRGPLLYIEPGVQVEVHGTEGGWVKVTVEGSQWGRRTGYVDARLVEVLKKESAAQVITAKAPATPIVPAASQVSLPAAQPAEVPKAAPPVVPVSVNAGDASPRAAPRPIALRDVRRIYIEKMAHDLDQYITAEFTKQMKGKAVVVLDKSSADAILRGVAENRTGTGAAITGRYLGLHDNANASVTLVDASETQILWAGEAGDRSLFFGVLKRGGQRKVADRVVKDLKKALEIK